MICLSEYETKGFLYSRKECHSIIEKLLHVTAGT